MALNSRRITLLLVCILLFCCCQARAELLSVENATISVTLNTDNAALSVADKRTGQTWGQQPQSAEFKADSARKIEDGIEIRLVQVPTDSSILATLQLDKELPEFTLTLLGEGQPKWPLRFPHPFVTEPGTYLVVPMNEGISYPVEDQTIEPTRLVAYGGHGICMAFWGATDGQRGYMAIIETPDDASIDIRRFEGRLCVVPLWEPQKGKFGYARKLRYVFFDKGGHVAMCKRYRAYAQKAGLFKTLKQKQQENPNVDLLIGAVNVWCWEKDALAIVRELKSLGIERILWSNQQQPAGIKAMNEMPGVLTSRYDIYQDLMDPQVVKEQLRGVHPDWTQAGWPKDIMLDQTGDWRKGWQVKGKDGQMYPCGVLCDKQALKYARERMPEDLKTHPYRCRFHRHHDRLALARVLPSRPSDDPQRQPALENGTAAFCLRRNPNWSAGSETGHDAAVPYVHYFEGMLSLGPYRVPDAGRDMSKIWDEVPQRVAKFQLGHKYRLPLWELVYHDCVVAQWYWGDYNNKLPALWDKRDLFNHPLWHAADVHVQPRVLGAK